METEPRRMPRPGGASKLFSLGLKAPPLPSEVSAAGGVAAATRGATSANASTNGNAQSPNRLLAVRSGLLSPSAFSGIRAAVVTEDETVEHEMVLKILVVGNPKCGKSSVINRYVNKTFDPKYKSTVGTDFMRKKVLVKLPGSEKRIGVLLQFWDIAGQDRFQKVTRPFFQKAKGVVIVCDVSREGTVEAVRNWKEEIDNFAGNADLPVVLFANKADLLNGSMEEAVKMGATMERMCSDLNILGWWITSARTGDCLDEGFRTLVQRIAEKDVLGGQGDWGQDGGAVGGAGGFKLHRVTQHSQAKKTDNSIGGDACC